VSLTDLPTLESWADDLNAVAAAVELDDAVLFATAVAAPVGCCTRRPVLNGPAP
jgi:hypothetical protein